MTHKTRNKSSPEVRERSVRMVLDHERDHRSRWAAVTSITGKIGCTAQTLNEWVKKIEVDNGMRAGVSTDAIEKMKDLGLRGVIRGKPVKTTISNKAEPCPLDHVNRQFAEVIHRCGPWKSFKAVELATLEWDDWFNNRRRFEPIGNIPPAEAEKNYYAMLDQNHMTA